MGKRWREDKNVKWIGSKISNLWNTIHHVHIIFISKLFSSPQVAQKVQNRENKAMQFPFLSSFCFSNVQLSFSRFLLFRIQARHPRSRNWMRKSGKKERKRESRVLPRIQRRRRWHLASFFLSPCGGEILNARIRLHIVTSTLSFLSEYRFLEPLVINKAFDRRGRKEG